MSFTLSETLRQIDPFVQLSNGQCTNTVEHWLELIDKDESTEYILSVDDQGRFLIHQLDVTGYQMLEPAFVEKKWHPARTRPFDLPVSFLGKASAQRYV